VLKHYQTALAAAGWKPDGEPEEVPGELCDTTQDFSKGKEQVGVYVFGSGSFTLTYRKVPWQRVTSC
jgi:hypothetical protein